MEGHEGFDPSDIVDKKPDVIDDAEENKQQDNIGELHTVAPPPEAADDEDVKVDPTDATTENSTHKPDDATENDTTTAKSKPSDDDNDDNNVIDDEDDDSVDEGAKEKEVKKSSVSAIHAKEGSIIARKIIDAKSKTIDSTNTTSGWARQGRLYQAVVAIGSKDVKDGALEYETPLEKYTNIPLNIHGEAPWVIAVDGNFLPAQNGQEGAVQLVAVTNKDKQNVTCVDAAGNEVTLPLDTLANAAMSMAAGAGQREGVFAPDEAVASAFGEFFNTGNLNTLNALYESSPETIREVAKSLGLVSIDAVDAYLEKAFAEIKPANGKQLTAEEQSVNEKRLEVKQKIRDKLQLSDRAIASHDIISEAIAEGSGNSQHSEDISKMLGQVMSEMNPDLAKSLSESLADANIDKFYKKLLDNYKDNKTAMDMIMDFKDKYGEMTLMVGGGVAILILLMALRGMVSQKM